MVLQAAVLEPLQRIAAPATVAVSLRYDLRDRCAEHSSTIVGLPVGQEARREAVPGGGKVEAVGAGCERCHTGEEASGGEQPSQWRHLHPAINLLQQQPVGILHPPCALHKWVSARVAEDIHPTMGL